MSYEIRNEIPCVEDYIGIRLKAGLSRKSVEAASIGLKNSIFGVVVYFNDKNKASIILLLIINFF